MNRSLSKWRRELAKAAHTTCCSNGVAWIEVRNKPLYTAVTVRSLRHASSQRRSSVLIGPPSGLTGGSENPSSDAKISGLASGRLTLSGNERKRNIKAGLVVGSGAKDRDLESE